MRKFVSVVVVACLVTSPAIAGPKYIVQPVPVGAETVRFLQGVPTLDLQRPRGSVQVRPLPDDHGGLAFSVAVFNNGPAPANIDISNFDMKIGDEQVVALSREQLEKKAKNRAMWATLAVAAAGGLAAAAAASQRDHYSSTTYTPHGTYRSYFSAPSVAGQIQATALAAGTGVGIAAIQTQLDRTREALGATTVQLTTIDPGDSYAGRVVFTKAKTRTIPQKVAIVITWNGDSYSFAFQLVKPGTPQPPFPLASVPVTPVPAVAVTDPTGPKVLVTPAPATVTPIGSVPAHQ